ncbi:MAG: hypothetical protein RJQ09_12640 [Cyclobacteriaceae bacterium]
MKFSPLFLIVLFCCQQKEPIKSSILEQDVISTAEFHESISHISDDANEIYFTRSSKNFKSSTLLIARKFDSVWEIDTLEFSGVHYDAGLSVGSDGWVYFTSKRPTGIDSFPDEWNIWRTKKNIQTWLQPEPLSQPVNSNKSDCCFVINENGSAYFASNRDGSWDIFRIESQNTTWNNLSKPVALNSDSGEWPAYIAENDNLLLISSIRESGFGGDDIYFSKRSGKTWMEPQLIDSRVNSDSYEDSPLIWNDRFYYSSWKDTEFSKGVSNIYMIELSEVIDLE